VTRHDGRARPAVRGPALLFCPGDRPERFGKAVAAADTVILDLEDAVAPENKERARKEVIDAAGRLDPARTIVRINSAGTPWHDDDVAALAGLPDAIVMLPMAAAPVAVEALAPHPVVALCETAAGVLAAPAIAAAANCVGLMWGSEDLVADLGGRSGRTAAGTYPPAVEEARPRARRPAATLLALGRGHHHRAHAAQRAPRALTRPPRPTTEARSTGRPR
jgi:citrate lyase subunit beta/citryl-CoA lyase